MSRTNKPFRILSIRELCAGGYADLAELSVIFQHDAIEEDYGQGKIWRWKANGLMNQLVDGVQFHTPPQWQGAMINKIYDGGLSLNGLAVARHQQQFTSEEYMKFYMQIGYSLCGFIEVFGQNEASEYPDLKEKALPKPEDHNEDEYVETVIEYMLRVHAGKQLRL